MPTQASESLVLRTYPYGEADVIVSFFTRDEGKLRGFARRARKPKNQFGAGLERLSHVTMYYSQRENRELASLNRCDLIQSQFAVASDYAGCVALDYIAEVSENLLPPAELNERFFRLLLAVLEQLRRNTAGSIWQVVDYFSLWSVRLSGFLPELRVSSASRQLAQEMMTTPIGQLMNREWTADTAPDLRRLMIRSVQEQIERKLRSAVLLERL